MPEFEVRAGWDFVWLFCRGPAARQGRMMPSKTRSGTGRRTRNEPVHSRAHTDLMREHLADGANVAVLLDEALAGGDEGDVMYALRAISEARGGIASVATLYRTLSRNGNPRLSTLLALLRASGMRLRVERAGS
jgi:DNA-binding phage protein